MKFTNVKPGMLIITLHGGNRYSGFRILQKTDKGLLVIGMDVDENTFWFNPSQKMSRSDWAEQDDIVRSYPDINQEKVMTNWPFRHDTLKKLFNPRTKRSFGDMTDG
jgi:hypothetical protein